MNLSDLNNILYVEDNPQLRCVTKMALEVIGRFQVCDCDSSRSGLISASDFFPDLILLDVASCNQDGLATLERLRRLPHLRDTPAMFVTGLAAAADVAQYVAAGAIGVIIFNEGDTPDPGVLYLRGLWRVTINGSLIRCRFFNRHRELL